MSKTEASKMLARFVSEAITDAECDIQIFTGNEGYKPDPFWGKKLSLALKTLGYDEAAKRVEKEIS